MSESTICETAVTIDAIAEIINKHFNTNASVKSFDANLIGEQQGFMSRIARISNIVWSDNDGTLPMSIVAKIPTIENFHKLIESMGEDMKEQINQTIKQFDLVRTCIRTEDAVYTCFAKVGAPTKKLAKYYGSVLPNKCEADDKPGDPAPFLLFEDLSQCSVPRFMNDGLTFAQFDQFVDTIAEVQAWSIKNKEHWVDNAEMKFAFSDDFYDQVRTDKSYEDLKKAFAENSRLAEVFGPDLIAKLDGVKCEKIRQADTDNPFAAHIASCMPDVDIPHVLVHGDAHPFNLLFEKDANGDASDTLRALIDWQVVNAGNPMFDFCRLMMATPEDKIRMKHWPTTGFTRWYDGFTKALGKEHRAKYSKDDMWRLYETTFYYFAAHMLPSVVFFLDMKDGAMKGFVAERDVEKYMMTFKNVMVDALEIKARLDLH